MPSSALDLADFICRQDLKAEIVAPGVHMPTVDAAAAAQEWGYAGGGRSELLVKIRSADIIRLADATVADVLVDDPRPL
jgi:hypothetical protein